jgi:hypothetical protein
MSRTLAALSLLAIAATACAQPPKNRPGWFSDYESGRAEARKTGKPIFLVFRCEP